jgi:hypothetical protein
VNPPIVSAIDRSIDRIHPPGRPVSLDHLVRPVPSLTCCVALVGVGSDSQWSLVRSLARSFCPRVCYHRTCTRHHVTHAGAANCVSFVICRLLAPPCDRALTTSCLSEFTVVRWSRIASHASEFGSGENASHRIAHDAGDKEIALNGPPDDACRMNDMTTPSIVVDGPWNRAFTRSTIVCSTSQSTPCATPLCRMRTYGPFLRGTYPFVWFGAVRFIIAPRRPQTRRHSGHARRCRTHACSR